MSDELNIIEWVDDIDLPLLTKQRECIYNIIRSEESHSITEEEWDYLNGVLNMLDNLQDILEEL